MKKQLMIFDFVYTGIAAILLLTIAILQNLSLIHISEPTRP